MKDYNLSNLDRTYKEVEAAENEFFCESDKFKEYMNEHILPKLKPSVCYSFNVDGDRDFYIEFWGRSIDLGTFYFHLNEPILEQIRRFQLFVAGKVRIENKRRERGNQK